jgi:hypothetical protein
MAFCNKCGANVEPGVRFCNKCGAPILTSTLPPAASAASASPMPSTPSAAPAPPSQGGGALKVILIVVGVIVLIGILGAASIGFVVWRVARSSHVRQEGDRVKVETPFGTVESTKDPEEVARNLGVEIYPGARVLKEGAASATFGGIHTATANFESDDSVGKVCEFYKPKVPSALVTASDQRHCTIVSNDKKNMITINVEAEGDKTKIQITNVTGKSAAPKPSSN